MFVLYDEKSTAWGEIGGVFNQRFENFGLRCLPAYFVDGIAQLIKISSRSRFQIQLFCFSESCGGDSSTIVAGESQMLQNGFGKRLIKFETGFKPLGEISESFVRLRLVFFQLSLKTLLKLRNILPKFGKNSFEITLEFSSQTKFEFFTIHLGFSSNS